MSNKDTSFKSKPRPISCNGKVLDFEEAKVMGILNITPDSFYDGGDYVTIEQCIARTAIMINEGAHIIDVGAFSSRPGAKLISEDEELNRIIPIITELLKQFPSCIFSIDTYRSSVARKCYDLGVGIINDISGGSFDPNMIKTIGEIEVAYVLMHMHGTPEDMQLNPINKDVVKTLKNFFDIKLLEILKLGNHNIIIDPGYGFGKSLESNFQILKNQESIRSNKLPILSAISRKSMINKILNTKPSEALTGTIALNMLALQNGANILRVHDVKEAVETIKLFNFYDAVE